MMKKTLSLVLTGLMLMGMLVSCGGDSEDTAVTTTVATTTQAPNTTIKAPSTTKPTTTEAPSSPEKPEDAVPLTWFDNNGDTAYYEITPQDDGSVKVAYTKEAYADAANKYGYAGYSWVNMAADVAGIYDGQSTLIIKIQGTEKEQVLIKPFDDQAFEKTITFTGGEQEIVFDLNNVSNPSSTYIIVMGAAGATDVSGEFTIVDAYFVD